MTFPLCRLSCRKHHTSQTRKRRQQARVPLFRGLRTEEVWREEAVMILITITFKLLILKLETNPENQYWMYRPERPVAPLTNELSDKQHRVLLFGFTLSVFFVANKPSWWQPGTGTAGCRFLSCGRDVSEPPDPESHSAGTFNWT